MSGQRDDGQDSVNDPDSIETFVREEFEVVLADLPGAGYEWVPRAVPAGLAFLSTDWAGPVPPDAGASRRKAFRFSAEQQGIYHLVFDLVRPWEGSDVTPQRQHTVSVLVGPSR